MTKILDLLLLQTLLNRKLINYLVCNEEIEELASKINKSKSLYPGERIIVFKEGEKYIVLEGNRRVCACKILHDIQLLKNIRPASANNLSLDINQEAIENTLVIDADVMPSRLAAQSALAAKHIDGIKKWSSISKQKFFALQYESGKSLQEIVDVTGSSKSTIKSGITNYKLICYALNLPLWTSQEKSTYLSLEDLKISRYTRVFTAKPRDEKITLKELLGLTTDENFNPKYSCSKEIFDYCLYLVARAAFIDKDSFDTRSTYEDISGLVAYMKENGLFKNDIDVQNEIDSFNVHTGISSMVMPSPQVKHEHAVSNKSNVTNFNQTTNDNDETQSKIKINKNATSSRQTLIPEHFSYTCSSTKINNISLELKALNCRKFVNACAVLFRVYIELCCNHYLNSVNHPEMIEKHDLKSTVSNTVNLMSSQQILGNNTDKNIKRLLKNENLIVILNGYIHHNDVFPIADDLISYFDNFEEFIKIMLAK